MFGMTYSTLGRNIVAAGVGTAAGQVVVLAFSPLITRIYSPEVFGQQGIFLSLISMLSPIITLRYSMAIVVAKNRDEAQCLSRLSLMIAFCFSSLCALMLLVGPQDLIDLLGAGALGSLIWFLPLALFCVGLQDVADFSAARLGRFRAVGFVTVALALVSNLARVIFGQANPTAGVLVAVTSVAPALQAVMISFGTRVKCRPTQSMTRVKAVSLLKSYREFPIYRVPTDVLHSASQSVPVFLLAGLYSPSAAGLYVLARNVVNLPLNVLGSAFGNVIYVHLAELSREGKPLLPIVTRVTIGLLLVPGTFLALVALVFPSLFALAFGEEWRTSGQYAQLMVLWIIGQIVNVPSVRALAVIGRQGWHLFFNFLIFAGGILGMLSGHALFRTALGSIGAYSATISFLYVIQIVTYIWVIKNVDRGNTNHE